MTKHSLNVTGMHCKSCSMLITGILEDIGASNISVKLDEYIAGKPYIKAFDIFRDVYKIDIGRLSSAEIRSKYTHIGIFFKRQQWKKGVGLKRGYYFRRGHEHDHIPELDNKPKEK